MKKCKLGCYEETSKESIYKHALILKDKSLEELYAKEIGELLKEEKGKGRIGNMVERLHFEYETNSRAEPDFVYAGLELKTSPLKIVGGKLVSKERLVLGMIDYYGIDKELFESSSFLKKNSSLLLLFYLYEKGKNLEQVFKIIKLWEIPECDLPILKQDWEAILKKVKEGKAHEISGGDTFYLEAARKGAGGDADWTNQPHSREIAKRRAYAFKSAYVNQIISEESNLASVVSPSDKFQHMNIEEYITDKFNPYLGMSVKEISNRFGLPYSLKKKDIVASLSKAILGIDLDKKVAEFEKAGIKMKTITLENNGRLKESMSFQQINYKKIISEKWPLSDFYREVVNRKYFFVIFRKDEKGVKRLERVLFWNMPYRMQVVAKTFWTDAKKKILAGNVNSFWKSKDDKYFHIRTKARNAADVTELRDGTKVKKMAYWLNRKTVLKIINNSY